MNSDTIVRTQYTSIYNMRPQEMYGMGKESLVCSHPGMPLGQFLEYLQKNSSIKFEDDTEFDPVSETSYRREDWTKYIGQPMFFLVDIEIEEVK